MAQFSTRIAVRVDSISSWEKLQSMDLSSYGLSIQAKELLKKKKKQIVLGDEWSCSEEMLEKLNGSVKDFFILSVLKFLPLEPRDKLFPDDGFDSLVLQSFKILRDMLQTLFPVKGDFNVNPLVLEPGRTGRGHFVFLLSFPEPMQ